RDPLERFRTGLRKNAELNDQDEAEITSHVKRLLNEALQRAEDPPVPDPSALLDGVDATPADLDTPHHKHPAQRCLIRSPPATPVRIVLRLTAGGGFGGGPFHSQNPESSFAHIPGLKCVCPATPEDAKGLLISAIEDPNPVLYFEHKHLYRRIKTEVPEERYTTPIGKARIHREGTDISVITWGAMVYTADDAAQQLESDGVSVEA